MNKKDILKIKREFLRDDVRLEINFAYTDQNLGIGVPPLQKTYESNAELIKLPDKKSWKNIDKIDVFTAIDNRKSHRNFKNTPITMEELAFLLWATQGIQCRIDSGHAYRTVPSAGCRHSFETYLCIINVAKLEQGVYRYLPLEHSLILERKVEYIEQEANYAALGQRYLGDSAVTFIWTAIPYRMEWRYDLAAHKVIAIDIGHVCQNLYIACEAIRAGTCAIAAYNQNAADELIGVDGKDEFTIYMAPVGKI